MINFDKTHQVADIIHDTIPYSGLEGAIISNPIINRLHRISQGSLVGLTFSSNKVKRFEHSLGTMHIAGEILFWSFNNVEDKDLIKSVLEECKEEIIKWINAVDFSKEKALKQHYADKYNSETIFSAPIPKSSLYRAMLPHIVSEEDTYSYLVLFEATRIAALLHDVGHLPYSHIFEHAIDQLYNMVKNVDKKNNSQLEFLKIMQPYCESGDDYEKRALHEEIGINLVNQIRNEINEELAKQLDPVNLYVLLVFEFVVKILSAKNSDNTIFSDIHKIIAGVLDADRLDYCSRDMFCSGVRKDVFPYHRILSNYRIMRVKPFFESSKEETDSKNENTRSRVLFCPAVKNVGEVEDLIERRWKINSSINFHHRVHKQESIFSEILAQIGFDELMSLEEGLKELQHGRPLPLALSSIWQLVKKLQSNHSLIDYFVIQLDDSWLDTLLKREFFDKYYQDYRNEEIHSNDPQWNKFDELISARKHYYSAYKRSADFYRFDSLFYESWVKAAEDKKDNIYINKITEQFNSIKKRKLGLLNLNLIKHLIMDDKFFQEIEDELNSNLGKGNTSIINCMIRPLRCTLGFSENSPVCFWTEKNGFVLLEMVSEIRRILTTRQNISLPFHLYYLSLNNTNDDLELLEKILIDILIRKTFDIFISLDKQKK